MHKLKLQKLHHRYCLFIAPSLASFSRHKRPAFHGEMGAFYLELYIYSAN